ncbi:hypothetical protein HDU91_005949 [Kappamyces sp. JEL0680]|nr:hypothetical protein HDU91_005949 [Kappamyces sp. JEL0680]
MNSTLLILPLFALAQDSSVDTLSIANAGANAPVVGKTASTKPVAGVLQVIVGSTTCNESMRQESITFLVPANTLGVPANLPNSNASSNQTSAILFLVNATTLVLKNYSASPNTILEQHQYSINYSVVSTVQLCITPKTVGNCSVAIGTTIDHSLSPTSGTVSSPCRLLFYSLAGILLVILL